MVQAYSSNITVAANAVVPLNTVTLQKGCSAVISGASTIALNKAGIYMVSVNASGATSATAGDISLQLYVDGVAVPAAVATTNSTATTDTEALSFVDLVQVKETNKPCCCATSPTAVTIMNVGEGATWSTVNVVVTKVC